MDDSIEILLRLCEKEWAQGRQCENHRSIITNILIVMYVGLVSLIIDKNYSINTLPLSILLSIVAIFGGLMCSKYYERWEYSHTRGRLFRKKLNELSPNANIIAIIEDASREQSKKHKISSRIRLNKLWQTFHIMIAIIGVVLSVIIVIYDNGS